MKNALILHGTGGNPHSYWLPYIKEYLQKEGYKVWVPQLPNTDLPILKNNLEFIFENFDPNNETVMVGHSSGCPLILSILERINIQIRKAVLVAGFYKPLNDERSRPILQDEYNWSKIRQNVREIIFINSDNDPWGCDDKMGKEMSGKVDGKLIVTEGEGHMGSDSFNQPYKEFPLLKKLLK